MSFSTLGLSPAILKTLEKQGYKTPTAIQAKAVPAIIEGRDVLAAAQTGSGKTAGFTLPLLQRLSKSQPAKRHRIRALILTPTRELAAQVAESVETYGANLNLRYAVVFGGVKINPQISKLRQGVDILIATPGRLLDLHQQGAFRADDLEVLVLDEADRMLDMGFIRDIKKIMSLLPKQRQNLLFSATFSKEIRALAKGLVHNPVEISVSPPNSTVETVKQLIHPVDKARKSELLAELIHGDNWDQVLVFTRTKSRANRLARYLNDNQIYASAIHGNKSQGARTKALSEFKKGEVRALVATDIAARGLDIDLLPYVVNFDLPQVAEDYVHRIGRTGRAGATGEAISLVSADEADMLSEIETVIKQKLERIEIDGFEPNHVVPTTPSKKAAAKPRQNSRKKPYSNPRNRANPTATKSRRPARKRTTQNASPKR